MGFVGGASWSQDLSRLAGFATVPFPYFNMHFNMRYSTGWPFSYRFVSGGSSVILKFLEPNAQQVAGARVFDVAINGQVVLPALDIARVAGALQQKDYAFPIVPGIVTVTFTPIPGKGNAIVSGVEFTGSEGCSQ